MKKFRVELVWNGEFDWSHFGEDYDDLELARQAALSIRDSGDGARVKKARIVDNETDEVVIDAYQLYKSTL